LRGRDFAADLYRFWWGGQQPLAVELLTPDTRADYPQ
jgi:hypothetical protein